MNLKRTLSLLLCLAFALGMFATCGAAEPEATDNPYAMTIVTDDTLSQAEDTSGIRGGTNQNDAVLLPLNTKLYGTATANGLWYAFRTRQEEGVTYKITTINKSVYPNSVFMSLIDELGKSVGDYKNYATNILADRFTTAGSSGRAITATFDNLTPDTVYYIKIWTDGPDDTIVYRLNITPVGVTAEGRGTADSMLDARGTNAALEGIIAPGTNMDDAGYLPLNSKLSGTVSSEQGLWFAFKTNTIAGPYSITTVNMTADAEPVYMGLVNRYGVSVGDYKNYATNILADRFTTATNDGTAITASFDELNPETTYYIRITSDAAKADYTLTINAPEEPATPAPATVEPLIFETPFELNETRVMFVGDEATFIDEAAAREACAPVADVILAHPDHQVLLVGTTASNGSDEYCLDLSSRRAAAVKDLLVNAYGVPEDQLLTVGLGYKLDPFARANDLDANGKLIESEACKNRRVIVLDAEDPIAQEILASNG